MCMVILIYSIYLIKLIILAVTYVSFKMYYMKLKFAIKTFKTYGYQSDQMFI